MDRYQAAPANTRQFEISLVEMVVVPIHYIAVLLFRLDEKLHKGDINNVLTYCDPPNEEESSDELPPLEPTPTLFFHYHYLDFEQYPFGLADVAGYWAENSIFGGVILFQRGKPASEVCQRSASAYK
jgi:hypothetical protein